MIYKWWAWEIAAGAVSVVATIALIAVLKTSDQKQQRPWIIGNTQLTLNTIIAILSTIMRAALVVMLTGALNQSPWNWFSRKDVKGSGEQHGRPLKDLDLFGEAASNSWASLRLLYRTKFRYLASWGALLLILSLGFDAFTQQVLTVEARSQADGVQGNSRAPFSIARSTYYMNVIDSTAARSGIFFIDHDPNPPLAAQAAILSGILNSSIPALTASCPTGNCTWPITPTNAICGACDDARDQAVWVPNKGSPSKYNYTISLEGEAGNNLTVDFQRAYFAVSTAFPSGIASDFQPGRQNITMIKALGLPASVFDEGLAALKNHTHLKSLAVAYSCSLYSCLQAYNTSTTNGVFNQQVLEPWDQMNATVPANFSISTWGLGQPQPNWTFTNIPPWMNTDAALEGPVIDFESRYALHAAFSGSVAGQVGYNVASSPTFDGVDGSGDSLATAASVQAFWLAANSSDTMASQLKGMADALTFFMRTKVAAPVTASYAPISFIEATFVVVRWPWLSYPLLLLLATYAYCFATVIQTRRLTVVPWKSQRLPLLLASVDETIRELAAGGMHRYDGLQDRVGRIRAQMEFDGRDQVVFRRAGTELRKQNNSESASMLVGTSEVVR